MTFRTHTSEERQNLETLISKLKKETRILQEDIRQLENELVQGVWTMSQEDWDEIQRKIDADPYVQATKRWYAETLLLDRLIGVRR